MSTQGDGKQNMWVVCKGEEGAKNESREGNPAWRDSRNIPRSRNESDGADESHFSSGSTILGDGERGTGGRETEEKWKGGRLQPTHGSPNP